LDKLTSVEAWLLSRVKAGYPVPRVPAEHVRAEVLQLAGFIAGLGWKDRDFSLRQQLGAELFARVEASDPESPAPSQPRRAWQIVPADHLAKLPKAKWLLPGLLPESGLSVLFGPSGAYKSFMALDYALRVAQSHSVIYTIYEGISGYWQRIKAWTQHHNQGHGKLHVCLGSLAVMNVGELGEFIEDARTIGPKLVIVDTLARAMTGSDENSTRDMGLFIAACDRIRVELNTAVLIIHHTNKGGLKERGSVALRGAADIMIKQRMEDDTIITECEKSKDSEPFEAQFWRPLAVPVTIDDEALTVPVLVGADRIIDDGTKLTANQRKVLEVLTLEMYTDGATAQEIGDALPEIARGSLIRVLSRLLTLKYVDQDSKRSPYRLTEAGKTRLTRLTRLTHPGSADEVEVSLPSQSSQSSLQVQNGGSEPSLRPSQRASGPSQRSARMPGFERRASYYDEP